MEFDQRRRLGRVVDRGVDRVGVPPIGEVVLRVAPLDRHLQRQVVVVRDGEPTPDRRTGAKPALELDAEPGTEFFRVRDSTPYARARRAHLEPLFDTVRAWPVLNLVCWDAPGFVASPATLAGSLKPLLRWLISSPTTRNMRRPTDTVAHAS